MSDGPPVSLSFFVAALDALIATNGSRLLGKGNEADEIRKHLGHIEAIYATLPEETPPPDERALELERAAKRVEAIRREAHDYGLEAFPKEFWESCEIVENALRAGADSLREEATSE